MTYDKGGVEAKKMGKKGVIQKIFYIPIVLLKIIKAIFSTLFPIFIIILGLGICLNSEPIPGLNKELSLYVGILVIAIGGAIIRRQNIAARARIQAKVFKEEFARAIFYCN